MVCAKKTYLKKYHTHTKVSTNGLLQGQTFRNTIVLGFVHLGEGRWPSILVQLWEVNEYSFITLSFALDYF